MSRYSFTINHRFTWILVILSCGCNTLGFSFSAKKALLSSLEKPASLNLPSRERTDLVQQLTIQNPTKRPGSKASFQKYSTGTWNVIYAPHIATFRVFDPVIYDLQSNGSITSHAKVQIGENFKVWLSVAGKYGSHDDNTSCRVDFDQVWVKVIQQAAPKGTNEEQSTDQQTALDEPYRTLASVPDSWHKNFIQNIGKLLFIPQFSIFPVTYLDDNLIVFDFELLGTRICATKVGPPACYYQDYILRKQKDTERDSTMKRSMERPLLDQILASTVFRLEMSRVEASSKEDEQGRYGEPMEWSESDSIVNQFSKVVASNPLGYRFKQWAADLVAGDYDTARIRQRIQSFVEEDGVDVVMFSFTTCPFCRRAKDTLSERGISFRSLELDEDEEGNLIRAELGRLVKRTSVPSIFVRGRYVGGCNDGPGLLPLTESGEMEKLLQSPRQSLILQ